MKTRRLRTVIVASVLGATSVVFGLVYAGMSVAYDSAVKQAAEQSTEEFAKTVFAGLRALMATGADRHRLEEYLGEFSRSDTGSGGYKLKFHRFLDEPVPAHPGAAPIPNADPEVIGIAETGQTGTARDGATVRVLLPLKATAACQRCHAHAAVGQTLGVVDVVHDISDELTAGRRNISWLLLVLIPVPLVGAGIGSWILDRRIRRSVALVDEHFPDVDVADASGRGRGAPPDLGFTEFNALFASLAQKLRRTEHHLEQNERQFRSVIENTSDLIAVVGGDGTVQYANPAAERLTGHRSDELVGSSLLDFVHLDDRQEAAAAIERAHANPSASVLSVVRTRSHDDAWRTLEMIGKALPSGSASGPAVVVTARDITERDRVLHALRSSEERFHSLYTWMNEGVAIYRIVRDDAGGIADFLYLDVNPSFEAIAGLARDVVVGHKASEFGAGGLAPYLAAWARAVASGKLEGVDVAVEALGKTLRVSAFSLRDDRFATIVEDVSEQKALEEQFRQAQKMEAIGTLAGGVAHDFNNLLTAILGYSSLLLDGLGPDHPLKGDVEEILKAGQSAASLTRQLLAFSRRQVLRPTVLDLNATVAGTEKMLRRMIHEDIRLVTKLEPALGRVKADVGQVEQVIMNLAVNARDAMPHGGTLTIETRNATLRAGDVPERPDLPPGPYVVMVMSDTGTGMTPEVQARIFEPFFTTKDRGKGTGLGLSTVYGIVSQSGGCVWASSEPGRGSAFTICLPRVEGALAGAEQAGGGDRRLTGTETILMVEDDDRLRSLVVRILSDLGYAVIAAQGGEDALRLAASRDGRIDLLLTDIVMPGMSGRQVAERVTALNPAIKVLYMSGYAPEATLVSDAAFLPKPFTRQALSQRVRQVLDTADRSRT